MDDPVKMVRPNLRSCNRPWGLMLDDGDEIIIIIIIIIYDVH
jgi:hypothetical protein